MLHKSTDIMDGNITYLVYNKKTDPKFNTGDFLFTGIIERRKMLQKLLIITSHAHFEGIRLILYGKLYKEKMV